MLRFIIKQFTTFDKDLKMATMAICYTNFKRSVITFVTGNITMVSPSEYCIGYFF